MSDDDAVRARKEQMRKLIEGTPHTTGYSRVRFPFTWWKDLKYDPKGTQWLVHRILPTEGFGVIWGKWKEFKSFIALHIGVCVARGDDWAGRKTKKGIVVYVAGEGAAGLKKRIEAYKQKHGYAELDLIMCPVAPNLGSSPGDVDDLVAAVRAALGDRVPALIIIDTLARTLIDEDENTTGMRNFVNNAESISAAFACLVMAVHHQGAGDTGRMRGGTTADAGSVATLRVSRPKKDNLQCLIEVQESKDEESGYSLVAQLVRFEFDETGESTLIVRSVEISPDGDAGGETAAKNAPRIPRNQAAFMTAFTQALEKHGINNRPFADGPVVRTVTEKQVFERYSTIRADAVPDTLTREFRRQLGNAVKREDLITRVAGADTLIWKAGK